MPPQRQLGLVSATALVVASMVGSGVFTTSGILLADLHSPSLVLAAWLAGGVIAVLGALCYGALARSYPESGGEYIFLARTLHPAAGYLAGWVSLLVGFSAPLAAVALAFGEYLREGLSFSTPRLTGSCLLLAFTAVHAIHVQRGAWVQNFAVLIKLLLIVLLVGLACARLEPAPQPQGEHVPIAAFAVSLVRVSFSYSGWNAAIYIAGEVRDPGRNLPRAMAVGAGLVTLLYVALNTVFVYAAPVEALTGKIDVARIAAESLGGASLASLVTALITLALATSASSMLMAGPRVYARMADDGYVPNHPRAGDVVVSYFSGPADLYRLHTRLEHCGGGRRVGPFATAGRTFRGCAWMAMGTLDFHRRCHGHHRLHHRTPADRECLGSGHDSDRPRGLAIRISETQR